MASSKEYMKQWRAANRERLAKKQAEWRAKNPERSKEINRESARKRRTRDPDGETKRVREWKRTNPDRRSEHQRRHRARHPLATLARQMVQTAVRKGLLVKPEYCEQCGKATHKRALHGHHEDYGRPLEVRWLCQRCHHERHQN